MKFPLKLPGLKLPLIRPNLLYRHILLNVSFKESIVRMNQGIFIVVVIIFMFVVVALLSSNVG